MGLEADRTERPQHQQTSAGTLPRIDGPYLLKGVEV